MGVVPDLSARHELREQYVLAPLLTLHDDKTDVNHIISKVD